MAIIYSLVCNNGEAGDYWINESNKSRYGTTGNYRCYASIANWYTSRQAQAGAMDTEVLHIGDAFIDSITSQLLLDYTTFPCVAIEITTLIDGTRSAGFHNGNVNAGYILNVNAGYIPGVYVRRSNVKLDGINALCTHAGSFPIRFRDGAFHVISNNISKAIEDGFRMQCDASLIYNNIAYECNTRGFNFEAYGLEYCNAYNNAAINCAGTGFYGAGSPLYGTYSNNYAFGCGVNWSGPPSAPSNEGMNSNFGEAGDVPWDTSATSQSTLTSADFIDIANNDARLSSNSKLIDVGVSIYGGVEQDMLGGVRPAYETSDEVPRIWDVGPFEYDKGYGPPAEQFTFTLENIPVGAEVRIYIADPVIGVIGTTELSGTESWAGGDYSYIYQHTGDIDIAVQVISDNYVESVTYYTLIRGNQTIPLVLTKEENE